MSEINPIETIAEVIGGIDYDYEQRDQARRIVSAIRTSPPLRRSLWLALTADNPLNRLSKAPSSPVETTAGSARPIPPDTLNGLTSGPEADEGIVGRLGGIIRAQVDVIADQEATIARMAADLLAKDATIDRLTRVSQIIMATADDNLAAKDATIDRLWRQLNEATNVPDHNDPEFGFDKTAALSEPDEETATEPTRTERREPVTIYNIGEVVAAMNKAARESIQRKGLRKP